MLLKAPKNREAWSTLYLEWEILEHYPHLHHCSARSYYSPSEAASLLGYTYFGFMRALECTHSYYGVVLSNGEIKVHPENINKLAKARAYRKDMKMVKGLKQSLNSLEKLLIS